MGRTHSAFPDMAEPWLQHMLGVEAWQWAALGFHLIAMALTYLVVRKGVRLFYKRRFAVAEREPDRRAGHIQVARAAGLFAAAAIGHALVMPSEFSRNLERAVAGLYHVLALGGAMLLALALWEVVCAALAERSDSKRTTGLLIPITRKLVRFAILVIGGLTALGMFGVDIVGVVAGLGITGIVVALAAKDSVENVFGSITIMFDMPFAIGDWVKMDKVEGIVEEINLRSTRIRTFEDTVITLPNANLIRASVENFGARRSRRQRVSLRFDYATPVERVRPFLEDVRRLLQTVPGVVPERSVVALNDFADANLGVFVQFFIEADSQAQELAVRERVVLGLLTAAAAREIRIGGVPLTQTPPDERQE